jgi:hypothetical protein
MAQQPITGPKLVVSAAITEADTNTTVNAIEIPAGAFIPPYGVSIYIPEVFAGGTPSIDVGDSGDPDGWIDTTEITETTIGMYSGIASDLAVTGKYYATADQIEAVVAIGLTGGTAYIIARYYDFSDLDVAAV